MCCPSILTHCQSIIVNALVTYLKVVHKSYLVVDELVKLCNRFLTFLCEETFFFFLYPLLWDLQNFFEYRPHPRIFKFYADLVISLTIYIIQFDLSWVRILDLKPLPFCDSNISLVDGSTTLLLSSKEATIYVSSA